MISIEPKISKAAPTQDLTALYMVAKESPYDLAPKRPICLGLLINNYGFCRSLDFLGSRNSGLMILPDFS